MLSGMMFKIKSGQKNCLYRMFSKMFRQDFGSKICQPLVVLPSDSKLLLQIVFQAHLLYGNDCD